MLITGATGGIGAALACSYAEPRRTLILHGRDPARLAAITDECEARGARILSTTFDLRDGDSVVGRLRSISQREIIDLAIVNAGVTQVVGREESSESFAAAVGALRTERGPERPGHRRIPVHATRDINDAEGLRFLSACAPDLLVSAFFDQRLREAALAIPARASVNIHPSLLPAFRGVDPVLQARLQGATRVGVTVHYMIPALDAGNVLAQRAAGTLIGASVFETTARLFDEGAQLLVEALGRIERGDPGTPQAAGGSYESWPSRAELRALRAGGSALIRVSDFARLRS